MTQDNTNKPSSCGKIKINYNSRAESPNEWVDGLIGDLYVWHDRYNFGEDTSLIDTEEGHLEGLKAYIQDSLKEGEDIEQVLFWPVFMYDHGGQCLYLHENFPDRKWDGSHIGWLVINPYSEEARGMSHELLLKAARNTFDMWDAYVSGDVYRVSAEDEEYVCYGSEELEQSVFDAVLQLLAWPKGAREPLLTDDQVAKITPLLKDPTTENINQLEAFMNALGYSLPKFKGELAEYYSIY